VRAARPRTVVRGKAQSEECYFHCGTGCTANAASGSALGIVPPPICLPICFTIRQRIPVLWKSRSPGKAHRSGLRPARWQAPHARPASDSGRPGTAIRSARPHCARSRSLSSIRTLW